MENQTLHHFYFDKPEPIKACLLALRSIILTQNEHISETVKYGMPCFCYHKKIYCYLWTDKKTDEPYILMADGQHLIHPQLEAGNRSRMKIFKVNPNQDLPIETIVEVLQLGLDFIKK